METRQKETPETTNNTPLENQNKHLNNQTTQSQATEKL